MVAGPGIEPRSEAYETSELPLLYPAIDWSEYKDSNLGPPGPKPGALPDCATLRINLLQYVECKVLL
jgi:hypothetical protein